LRQGKGRKGGKQEEGMKDKEGRKEGRDGQSCASSFTSSWRCALTAAAAKHLSAASEHCL